MLKPKTLLIGVAGVVVAGGLAYFVVKNARDQAATQEQLQQLRKQMAAASQPAPAAPGSGDHPFVVTGVTTRDGSVLSQEKAVNEVIDEGQRLLSSGNPEKAATAAKIFQEAIDKIDANNANFYSGLGQANLLTKHFPEATQAYHKALELSPKRSDLWIGIAAAYWGVKDYYHSKVAYEQAIAINPESMDAWSVMAWVYMGLGEQEKAVKGFRVLVDSGSDRADWKKGLTMARAGNIQPDQVRAFFPMPDPKLFQPPTGAATVPASR